MESIRLGGRAVTGFALGASQPPRPFTRADGFMLGTAVTALAGITGAALWGVGASPDDRIMNAGLTLVAASLGGGVAGLLATGRSPSSGT